MRYAASTKVCSLWRRGDCICYQLVCLLETEEHVNLRSTGVALEADV